MGLAEKTLYTADYIYSLPEGQRAELIDGVVYDLASPSRKHQYMVLELAVRIRDYIKKGNGNSEVYIAPFAVFLNNDDMTYVEPDISIICDKDKLDDRGCNGAPDWIIEVVSANNRQMDYVIKSFKYKESGVREYWIVDIERTRITVYNFENGNVDEYGFSDKVKAGIYDDMYIDFKEIKILRQE